jgi:hypothetical protein
MAWASRYETWPVRGKLQGKKGKKSKDLSGVDCTTAKGFPRAGLVIDDNMQEAQFVTVKDGEIVAGDMIALIDNSFEGKPLELDGEGVAYADGFFYVIGSHGHPRDSKRRLDPDKDTARIAAQIAASSQIVRFRSDGARATGAIERTAKLRALIAQQPALRSYQDQRLENNGLTIEGIAVRRGRILVGFRGPTLKGSRAAVLSVAVDGVFGKAAPDARLHRLPWARKQACVILLHLVTASSCSRDRSRVVPAHLESTGGMERATMQGFSRTLPTLLERVGNGKRKRCCLWMRTRPACAF